MFRVFAGFLAIRAFVLSSHVLIRRRRWRWLQALVDGDLKVVGRILGAIASGLTWSVRRSLLTVGLTVLAVISPVDGELLRLSRFARQLPALRHRESDEGNRPVLATSTCAIRSVAPEPRV